MNDMWALLSCREHEVTWFRYIHTYVYMYIYIVGSSVILSTRDKPSNWLKLTCGRPCQQQCIALFPFYSVLRLTNHAHCLLLGAHVAIIFFLSFSLSLSLWIFFRTQKLSTRRKIVGGYVSIPMLFPIMSMSKLTFIGTRLETKEKRGKK